MIKDNRESNLNVVVISLIFLISTAVFLVLHTQLLTKAFAVDNNWYVGEGVTKDMYVKYRISHFDVNNGREFTMVIYFKGQDDKNEEEDKGEIKSQASPHPSVTRWYRP